MANTFGIPEEDWKFVVQMIKETKGSVTYIGPGPCPKPVSSKNITLKKKS